MIECMTLTSNETYTLPKYVEDIINVYFSNMTKEKRCIYYAIDIDSDTKIYDIKLLTMENDIEKENYFMDKNIINELYKIVDIENFYWVSTSNANIIRLHIPKKLTCRQREKIKILKTLLKMREKYENHIESTMYYKK